ncbi:hypothetical protein GORHZ_092_00170 [Gordonia rhizosphera NBRC 16068]|uniref:HTH luxR-type domain-containing protein n=2 Tax=Gordonia rhizosphera TaxID=83341 RepID=K6V2N5_9ACTN|nr:hypothetical protein GORHZ_092_00170 [Gordonia rhizosphera NBRC 16068]
MYDGFSDGPLIGHSEELVWWADLLQRLPRTGGLLALVGEPGIGKSRLQLAFNESAGAKGFRVLHLRCRETDAASAYRPLIEALAPLSRPGGPLAGEADQVYRSALTTLRRLWEGGDPETAPLTVAESAVRVLSLLAGDRGLVVAVDDVQWADPETLVVLEHLARTVDLTPIALTVTARTDPVGAARIARMVDTPAARVTELGRLAPTEQKEMVVSQLGRDVPSDVIEFVAERAEGLPLAVEELLADLLRHGAAYRDHGAWVVRRERFVGVTATSIAAAVEARLAQLDADAQVVAVAVALRDDDSTWDDLTQITGQPADRVATGLADLVTADVLISVGRGRYRYRHGLIADAVLSASNPSIAQRLARGAALDLQQRPGSGPDRAAQMARLWECAGDPDAAARAHIEAASGWLAQGAAETAILSARAALARSRTVELRSAAADALSEALTRTGRFADALALQPDVLTDGDVLTGGDSLLAPRRALAYCRFARCAMEIGQPDRAARDLDAAEALDVIPVEVYALRATLAFEAGDADGAAGLAARAVALAEQAGNLRALGSALLVQARVLRSRDPADAIPGLERLVDLAAEHTMPVTYERAMLELGLVDRLTTNRADRLLEARRLAVERGSVHTRAVAETNLWPVLAESGDLAQAERMCVGGLELAERYRLRSAHPARTMYVMHEAVRGRYTSASTQVEELRGDPFVGGAELYLEVFRGDAKRALAAITPAIPGLMRVPDARAAPARGLYALLMAVVRDDPEPARLIAQSGIGAWYNRGLIRLVEAVVAGRGGDRVAADAAAAEGFTDLDRFPIMAAAAAVIVAPRSIDQGWGEPETWLGAARELFADLGNETMRQRCGALLRAGGFPVPRRGRGDAEVPAHLRRLGITSREMDVLLLVAQHLTNVQIAEQLTESPRTVDTHVSRLIAKAQVSNRSELSALVG